MRIAFLLPVLLGVLTGCEAPDPLAGIPCGMLMLAELPVTMAGRSPLVQVTIAGQSETMILDTGAEKTLLTQSAVNRLHLHSDPHMTMTINGVGGSSRNFPAILTGLNVGGQKLADLRAMVLPFELPQVAGRQVDGLLGVDVLGRFEVDLDLPHRRVGLYGGRLCPGEAIALAGPLVAMDAPGTHRSRLIVQATLDGTKMTALLDTGAESTIVMMPAMLRAGTSRADLQADQRSALHGAGPAPAPAWIHQFTSLALGGETVLHPRLQVTEALGEDTAWWLFRGSDDDDMIIGADYLLARRLWLAYPRRQVFVQRE